MLGIRATLVVGLALIVLGTLALVAAYSVPDARYFTVALALAVLAYLVLFRVLPRMALRARVDDASPR